MSHANALAQDYLDKLKALGYEYPDCINFTDEPSGDFGIAHASGSDANGCYWVSFDDAYLPSVHTIIHELGHVFQFYHPGLLEQFWSTVGFAISIDGANAQAETYAQQGMSFGSWQCWAVETFADFFAWTYLDDAVHTQTWGIPLTEELRATLSAFFTSWKGTVDELTSQDIATLTDLVSKIVDARVATAEVNILREVMTKIDSGFNTTNVAQFRRAMRGHDPDVAGNDEPIATNDSLFPIKAP